jgi:hypothetical protein
MIHRPLVRLAVAGALAAFCFTAVAHAQPGGLASGPSMGKT